MSEDGQSLRRYMQGNKPYILFCILLMTLNIITYFYNHGDSITTSETLGNKIQRVRALLKDEKRRVTLAPGGLDSKVMDKSPEIIEEEKVEMDWDNILHFIPNKTSHDCLTLFTTKTSKIRPKSNTLKRYYIALSSLKKEFHRLQEAGVNSAIGAPFHETLTLTYQELARQPWVKTVCEIGFNIGYSSLAWLVVKPDIVLHSFDIGTRPKSPYMAKFVARMFPGRFYFYMGDSRVTVPDWVKENGPICDVVSIDGNHDYEFVMLDLYNMRKAVKKRNILIADDIYMSPVRKAWDMFAGMDILKEHFRCVIRGIDIDFVLGYYTNDFDFGKETNT